MWAAREKYHGWLEIWSHKPFLNKYGYWISSPKEDNHKGLVAVFYGNRLPHITMANSPQKVELKLKKI